MVMGKLAILLFDKEPGKLAILPSDKESLFIISVLIGSQQALGFACVANSIRLFLNERQNIFVSIVLPSFLAVYNIFCFILLLNFS